MGGGKTQPWLDSPTDECNFCICEEEYIHYAWVYFGFSKVSFPIHCSKRERIDREGYLDISGKPFVFAYTKKHCLNNLVLHDFQEVWGLFNQIYG